MNASYNSVGMTEVKQVKKVSNKYILIRLLNITDKKAWNVHDLPIEQKCQKYFSQLSTHLCKWRMHIAQEKYYLQPDALIQANIFFIPRCLIQNS